MPWTLREHGALTPELLAPVVLLGAALLAASPRTAMAAGALAAVAPFIKWPYALALIAIVLFSAAPKKAIVGAAIAIAVQAVGFTVLFGFGLWDDSVIAQMYSGPARAGHPQGRLGPGLLEPARARRAGRGGVVAAGGDPRRAAAEGAARARRGDARDRR